MAESQLQVLTATRNRQCVLEGFHLNGVQYQVDNGDLGWHVTASPGRDPVNVYWVAGNKFYAVKIHILTDPCPEIQLELFDEITFVPFEEKGAILKAISDWES
jgi:hypothetical protein